MAEALGVAASGITIAQIGTQVGSAVFKLKQLWDEVKDVPDDISDLMEQIDCLSPVMWEVENNFNQGDLPSIVWDELASKSTTVYCRKALQNLTGMADELNLQIRNARKGRKKITAFKVLIKKESLKKLEKRLENAIRMLTLAQQSYLIALTRVQPNIIIERFNSLALGINQTHVQPDSESSPKTEGSPISNQHRTKLETTKVVTGPRKDFPTYTSPGIFGKFLTNSSTSGHTILLQAPMWLSRRSWELQSIKANGSWQYNLRSYSIIPRRSEIARLAMKGSPEDMQKLFDAGLASPYDRDEYGDTLLHRASNHDNLKVVRYLLMVVGMNPWERNNAGFYPVDDMVRLNDRRYVKEFTESVLSDKIFARKFLIFSRLTYIDEDEGRQVSHTECNCFQGIQDLGLYKALLPYQCPLHTNTSLESRIQAASRALVKMECSLEVVKLILEPEWSNDPQAIRSNALNTILPSAVVRLCISHDSKDPQDFFAFTIDIIKLTPDLHVQSLHTIFVWWRSPRDTALMCVANCFSWLTSPACSQPCYSTKGFSKLLSLWLEALKLVGVDLNAYGRREYEIFVHNNRYFEVSRRYGSTYFFISTTIYLIGFKFGPEPKDWEFYWADSTDEFAGDFWNLIENPPLNIPGSWVD